MTTPTNAKVAATKLNTVLNNYQTAEFEALETIIATQNELSLAKKSTQQTILDALSHGLEHVKNKADYKDFMSQVICQLTNGKCENVGQYGKEKRAGHHVLSEVNTWINKNFVNASKVNLLDSDSAKQLQETYKKKPAKKGAQNKVKASKKAVIIQPSEDDQISQLVMRLERMKLVDSTLFNATFKAMDKALATREAKLAK